MQKFYDVVIIGGGVAGCALAYYLARGGLNNIAVVERNHISAGATGACAGGIRTQLTSPIKIQMAQVGRRIFRSLDEELGFDHDLELDQRGYLSLVYSEAGLAEMHETIAVQRGMGVDVELMDVATVRELFPSLDPTGLIGGVYNREGATINPHLVTMAYLESARLKGAEVHTGTTVIGINQKSGRVTGALTDKGEFRTTRIINAAGLSLSAICRMAGLHDVAINVELEDAWITGPVAEVKCPYLTISWADPFFVFSQRRNGNILLLGNERKVSQGATEARENPPLPESVESLRQLRQTFPVLRQTKIIRHWLGRIPVSPDNHPIAGGVAELEGFYLAGPLCGHGFMLGPVIALCLAAEILGAAPPVDMTSLRLERFRAGLLLSSHELY